MFSTHSCGFVLPLIGDVLGLTFVQDIYNMYFMYIVRVLGVRKNMLHFSS